MKRNIKNCLLFSLFCILTSCSIFDINVNDVGIEEFGAGISEMSLCSYLTLRDECNEHFLELFPYKNAYFRHKDIEKGRLYHETAFMNLTYSNDGFEKARLDIVSKEAYSNDIFVSFNGYNISLNKAEILAAPTKLDAFTKYDFESENKYIGWINLVGINDDTNSILFIGFYYCESFLRSGTINPKYYKFTDWDTFFSEFFSDCEWDLNEKSNQDS